MSEQELGQTDDQPYSTNVSERQASPEQLFDEHPELGLIVGVMSSLKEQASAEAYQSLLADVAHLLQKFENEQKSPHPEVIIESSRLQSLLRRMKGLFGGRTSRLSPHPLTMSPLPIAINNGDYDAFGNRRDSYRSDSDGKSHGQQESEKVVSGLRSETT